MIRYTPTLTFELDTSIEQGVRLTQLIDSVNKRGDGPGNGE
jgi:ribosome-binding factor A